MRLCDLLIAIDAELVVTDAYCARSDTHQYTANLRKDTTHATIEQGGGQLSCYGYGSTRDKAIRDLAASMAGKRIAFDYCSQPKEAYSISADLEADDVTLGLCHA